MDEKLTRPYRIESGTWGQSIDVGIVEAGMMRITCCDFDSGQTVAVGLSVDSIDIIIDALRAVQAESVMTKLQLEEKKRLEREDK